MNYSEFISKVTEKQRYFRENRNNIEIQVSDLLLTVNFDSVFFQIERLDLDESYDDDSYDKSEFIIGWNVYDYDYVNVVLSPLKGLYTESDLVKDNLSRDEFFNYSLTNEVKITYEEYLDLKNVYYRLKELYNV